MGGTRSRDAVRLDGGDKRGVADEGQPLVEWETCGHDFHYQEGVGTPLSPADPGQGNRMTQFLARIAPLTKGVAALGR